MTAPLATCSFVPAPKHSPLYWAARSVLILSAAASQPVEAGLTDEDHLLPAEAPPTAATSA